MDSSDIPCLLLVGLARGDSELHLTLLNHMMPPRKFLLNIGLMFRAEFLLLCFFRLHCLVWKGFTTCKGSGFALCVPILHCKDILLHRYLELPCYGRFRCRFVHFLLRWRRRFPKLLFPYLLNLFHMIPSLLQILLPLSLKVLFMFGVCITLRTLSSFKGVFNFVSSTVNLHILWSLHWICLATHNIIPDFN